MLRYKIQKGSNDGKLLGFWILLRTETDPVSETLCCLVFRILDNRQSPKTSNSECCHMVFEQSVKAKTISFLYWAVQFLSLPFSQTGF
jgi:hypothetical protein